MSVRTFTARLRSLSPYTAGRALRSEKKTGEAPNAYEQRCWKERAHTDERGNIIIPAKCFTLAMGLAAQHLGLKIVGKANATWTKYIERGILPIDPLVTNMPLEEVIAYKAFVPADGGQKKIAPKVWKNFPIVPEWEGEISFMVLDPTLTPEIIKQHIEAAGQFIGVGTYTPKAKGTHGRFEVLSLTLTKEV